MTMASSFTPPSACTSASGSQVGSTTNVAFPSVMKYTLFWMGPITMNPAVTQVPLILYIVRLSIARPFY